MWCKWYLYGRVSWVTMVVGLHRRGHKLHLRAGNLRAVKALTVTRCSFLNTYILNPCVQDYILISWRMLLVDLILALYLLVLFAYVLVAAIDVTPMVVSTALLK
jgi:hypothetical protein